METFETNLEKNEPLSINDEIKQSLLASAKWAKIMSILGFIGLGLMIVASLIGFSFQSYSPLYVIIFIIIVVLYYFPINYLYQFSNGINQGINSNNQEIFTSGLRSLKSFYKFIGIYTIIIFSSYLLIILISLLMTAIK